MIIEEKHHMVELLYSDPSAAHDRAMRLKMKGSYRVTIIPQSSPRGRRFAVQAWFRNEAEAEKAL